MRLIYLLDSYYRAFYQDDLHYEMKTLPQQEEVVQRHAPIFATTVHAEHRHISPMFYGEANAFLGSPPVP